MSMDSVMQHASAPHSMKNARMARHILPGMGRHATRIGRKAHAATCHWDPCCGVIVGVDGTLFVAGNTSSFGAGSTEAFLLRVTPDGKVTEAMTWGGPWIDTGTSIDINADGHVVIGATATELPDAFLRAPRHTSKEQAILGTPHFPLVSTEIGVTDAGVWGRRSLEPRTTTQDAMPQYWSLRPEQASSERGAAEGGRLPCINQGEARQWAMLAVDVCIRSGVQGARKLQHSW